MGTEEDIKDALTPTVRAAGLDIWDVERSGSSVRVLVERSGGVDLDAISELSGAVSAVLDHRDDLVPAGHYTLEVSSPGLERRLRSPAHFARCVGEEVAVKTSEPFLGSRRLTGTLVATTDEGVSMKARGTEAASSDQLVQIPFPLIERAHLVFEWPAQSGPSRPGRPARQSPKASRETEPRRAPEPEVSGIGGGPWQE